MKSLRFGVISILVSIGLLMEIGATNAKAADYFPLEVGNRWVYTSSYGNGDRIDTIVGTESINGTLTYIRKREEAAPDNYHEKMWMAKEGSDLKVYKLWGNLGADPAVLATSSSTLYELNPAVGDTWEDEGVFNGGHYKSTFYVESISDTVTTPAGIFGHCIRIRELSEITQDGVTDYKYYKHWLAPDVGPVIHRSYSADWGNVTHSQELVSFSNDGHLHIDINGNQTSYNVGDTLRVYASIYNVGACQPADIYVALQLPDDTLLFYPDYSTTVHSAMPNPINICGSPFVSDYVLAEYTIPVTLPKGTYTWYAILTTPGSDPYSPNNWLGFDEAPFNVT